MFFFVYCSLLRVFCTENIIRKKKGQVLKKPKMRLLLRNPGSTFLQIQTDIYVNLNGKKECKCKYGSECVSEL